MVVIVFFPRLTPAKPMARIRRSTVHFATLVPSRRSCVPDFTSAIEAKAGSMDPGNLRLELVVAGDRADYGCSSNTTLVVVKRAGS